MCHWDEIILTGPKHNERQLQGKGDICRGADLKKFLNTVTRKYEGESDLLAHLIYTTHMWAESEKF